MTAADVTPQAETATTPSKALSGELVAFLIALVAAVLWGLSIYTFGIPGLYIPALSLVPVIYILLIVISRG
jgi:hypothetical protein